MLFSLPVGSGDPACASLMMQSHCSPYFGAVSVHNFLVPLSSPWKTELDFHLAKDFPDSAQFEISLHVMENILHSLTFFFQPKNSY